MKKGENLETQESFGNNYRLLMCKQGGTRVIMFFENVAELICIVLMKAEKYPHVQWHI